LFDRCESPWLLPAQARHDGVRVEGDPAILEQLVVALSPDPAEAVPTPAF